MHRFIVRVRRKVASATCRRVIVCLAVVAALTVGTTVSGVPASAATPGDFVVGLCPEGVFDPEMDVTCGSLSVPESREDATGRAITVAAAVIHAAASPVEADPIVFLNGGPSFGAISSYAMGAYFAGAEFIEHRDVVLVDTRGTGIAEPRLGCPEIDEAFTAAFYAPPFIDSHLGEELRAGVLACRDRLTSEGIDLSAYNSAESAADLDALRRALGYDQWNVMAFSADGVLALTYMRLFPDGIRSVVLDSAASAHYQPFLDDARGVHAQLEAIFAGCAANTACDARYPDIRATFYDLVDELQRHPVRVSLPDFEPNPVTYVIDGVELYLGAVDQIFPGDRFEPAHIHDVFDYIQRAANGELRAMTREGFGTGPEQRSNNDFVAEGKTMSYMCHDLVGFVTDADLARAAQDVPALAPFFLSPDYGIAGSIGPTGCDLWDVGTADPSQHDPVTSEIPTLVLAGEYDTGIAPTITRQIPQGLQNSYYYEFPAGSHGQIPFYQHASDCARAITAQFLAAPDAEPDATCIASVAPLDFTPP